MNRFLSRLAINSAAILIASAGACVMMVFLIIAFYLYLATMMEPYQAALASAGAALLFSLLVLLVAWLATRKARLTAQERARHRNAAELGELLGRSAHGFLAGNSLSLLATLAGLGFALGFSPRLRKLLMKLL